MGSYIRGFFGVVGAIGKFKKYGVRIHLFLSGLIGLILGIIIFYGGYSLSDDIGTKVVEWYPFSWGVQFVEQASAFIGSTIIIVVGLLMFKFLIMAVCSPILSFVSEKVEMQLVGDPSPTSFSPIGIIRDFIRGITVASTNLVKELFFLGLLALLGLVLPFAVPLITALAFLIQAYYAGYGNLDFFLERRFSARESNRVARNNRFGLMGIGTAFLLIIMVPVIGWILGPMMATIAATEYGVRKGLDPQLDPHL